jgi:hypothetical protein
MVRLLLVDSSMGTSIGHTAEQREGLEQIREILVGAVQHELERRLARTESHFTNRLNDLQQEARRRTEVIEAHLRKETEALSGRLDGELAELKEALRALARDHREAASALGQRVGKAEEALVRSQHELRQHILDQTKSFLDEVQQVRADLSDTLERELASLEFASEEEPGPRGEPREAGEKHS